MKRILIATLLVLAALAATGTHASAAGISRPMHTHQVSGPQPNDYYFYVQSCTGPDYTGSCAYLEAENSSSAAVGRPTRGYIECDNTTSTLYQMMFVDIGSWYDGYGTANGIAGTPSLGTIYSSFAASGYSDYYYDEYSGTSNPSDAGTVSGSATGTLKFNPFTDAMTGGKITLTLKGTIDNYSYVTGTWFLSQGTMQCSINPSGYDTSVSWD